MPFSTSFVFILDNKLSLFFNWHTIPLVSPMGFCEPRPYCLSGCMTLLASSECASGPSSCHRFWDCDHMFAVHTPQQVRWPVIRVIEVPMAHLSLTTYFAKWGTLCHQHLQVLYQKLLQSHIAIHCRYSTYPNTKAVFVLPTDCKMQPGLNAAGKSTHIYLHRLIPQYLPPMHYNIKCGFQTVDSQRKR